MTCFLVSRRAVSRRCAALFILLATLPLASLVAPPARADVSLTNIFSDHMVLQREQANKVWGKAAPGEQVTVKIADQTLSTAADDAGLWHVMLQPLPVGGPLELVASGPNNEVRIADVLVGEVWVCSGQSNMQWSVGLSTNADLEQLTAKNPNLRMINFPRVGSQEAVWEHPESQWMVCTPENVSGFSAVGYFFGRQL